MGVSHKAAEGCFGELPLSAPDSGPSLLSCSVERDGTSSKLALTMPCTKLPRLSLVQHPGHSRHCHQSLAS